MNPIVTPLPSIGDVVTGRDVAGRELRISGHPESDRVVLSIWQDGRCQATVRLARADVPEVTRALVATLVAEMPPERPPAPVHPLRPALERPDPAPGSLRDRFATLSRVTARIAGRWPGGRRRPTR